MAQTPEQRKNKALASRLWMLYRITPEEQTAVDEYMRRNGMSALLGQSLQGTGNDHSHDSGLYRGRLAFLINKAMGFVDAHAKTVGIPAWQILDLMTAYAVKPPAVEAIGPHYGLIGKAKRKKAMIYGSPSGAMRVELKPKKKLKKKAAKKPYVVNMSKGDGPIGNTD